MIRINKVIGRKFMIFLSFLVVLLVTVSSGWAIELVQRGKPLAVIAIGEKATKVENHAAAELQNYIYKISGARLKIVGEDNLASIKTVLIGTPSSSKLIKALSEKLNLSKIKYDGFVVMADGNQ